MTVKVLIERWAKAGHEETVWEMLRDLRSQAVRQRGYLYGETWRSADNPRVFVVISVWGQPRILGNLGQRRISAGDGR